MVGEYFDSRNKCYYGNRPLYFAGQLANSRYKQEKAQKQLDTIERSKPNLLIIKLKLSTIVYTGVK